MANKWFPWQRYLSDIAHKYVGYPDEDGEKTMIIHVDDSGVCDKTFNEIVEAAQTQCVIAIIESNTDEYIYSRLLESYIGEDYYLLFEMVSEDSESYIVTIAVASAATAEGNPHFSL